MVFICGCSQTSPPAMSEQSTEATSSSITTTTLTPSLPNTQATTRDPFVGTWIARSYLTSGPLKKEYTFLDNGTWTRTNTNLESLVQSYSQGTWKKESEGNYVIKSSITGNSANFEYHSNTDELYEPGFKETFYRVPEKSILKNQLPSMNTTVYSVQKVSKIQGATPHSGKTFLIINLSIENINNPNGFSFDDKNFRILYDDGPGGWSTNQQLEGRISNAMSPGVIAMGEIRTGNVVFTIPENMVSCTLKLVNNEGDAVSNSIQIHNIQTISA